MDRIFDKAPRFPAKETKSLRGNVPGSELAGKDPWVVSGSVWLCTKKADSGVFIKQYSLFKEERIFLEVVFLS